MRYTWHPERDGFGTVLEAEKSGVGTYAEGYRVVCNGGITYEDAVAKFGDVTPYDEPIPITIDVRATVEARQQADDALSEPA